MDDIIEFRQLLKIVRQKIWLILSVTIVLTLVAGIGSQFLLKPQYEATTDLLLNSTSGNTPGQQGGLNQNDITSNLMLIQTYTQVILSPRIMDTASTQLGIKADNLVKQVTVDNVTNSQVLSIHAKDPNANKAILIANTVARIFKDQIPTLMKVDNVNILTPAKEALQVWPRPLLIGSIACVFSLIVCIGIVVLREFLDTRLRTESQVEKALGLPVLGKVPVITKLLTKENMQPLKQELPLTLEAGGTEA